jgi:hypothetical protein
MGNLDRRLNPSHYDANGNPINPAPGGGVTTPMNAGGGSGQLNVDPAVLKRAAGNAGELSQWLNKEGRIADETTTAAANALTQEEFTLGASLKKTGELWYSQVTTLVQACHKIEQSLMAAAGQYKFVEDAEEMSMSAISQNFQ